jgi:DNA anti-recombination protein RmuC
MQTMRESWTDERLDDLNATVDRGFARVDERFQRVDERFDKVDERFERVNEEFKAVRLEMKEGFEAINGRMVQAVVAVCVGMLAGFGGLAGLIATQL